MNFFFAAGDAPFFFLEQLQGLSFLPEVWRSNEEFGISALPSLWIDYPFRVITYLLYRLGLSWFLIDKIWWFVVFSIAILGMYTLCKHLKISHYASLFGSLIYTTNTYILLLFDGGQLGVSLAYSLVPWVLYSALIYFRKPKKLLFHSVATGMLVSFLVLLDIRLAFITLLLLVLLTSFLVFRKQLKITQYSLLIPCILIVLNAFWILPTIVFKDSLAVSFVQKTGISGLSFFSVADFSHSLSMLHPNYPENLFGRVYFFKPEFLIIPILAFSIFLQESPAPISIFFGVIILLGAFLGKGVQEPLGTVYEWLYAHVPGFFLFRDPTKWYVLTALGYSLLLPQFTDYVSKKLFKGIIIVILLFWIFSLRLVFLGKVTGNVTPPVITHDYETLKNVLIADNDFGRTLWFPTVERFGYSSALHPSLSSASVFSESSPAGIIRELQLNNNLTKIKSAGVSYIIVPEDTEHKIFIDDYTYKESLREMIISELDRHTDLQKLSSFSRLAVYKVIEHDSLFSLNTVIIGNVKYGHNSWTIPLPNREDTSILTTLIAFDPNWRLIVDNKSFEPVETGQHLMNFMITSGESQTGTLYYLPNRVAAWGAIISGTGFIICCLSLIVFWRK